MAKRQKKAPARTTEKMRTKGGSSNQAEALQVRGTVSLERFLAVREKAENEPYILEVMAFVPNRPTV